MTAAEEPNLADIAAMPFEAWVKEEGDWTPPTNEEWPELADPHLIVLRIGYELLHKSKPEFVKVTAGNIDLAKSIVDRLEETEDMFRSWLLIVETARARALCAIAVIATGQGGA